MGGINADTSVTLNLTEYITLDLRLGNTDGAPVAIQGEFYMVPYLDIHILVAVDILHPYDVSLHVGQGISTWGVNKITVPMMTTRPAAVITKKRARRRVKVFASQSITVEPGMGHNIPVREPRGVTQGYLYLFEPESRMDLGRGEWMAASRALISADPQAIPVANFGAILVHVVSGQVLGHMTIFDPAEAAPSLLQRDVGYARAFAATTEGRSVDGDPYPHKTGQHDPNPQPFAIGPEPEDEEAVADVSSHWGTEYRRQVQAILDRHAELFRPGLGCFEDDIRMPIPFVDEKDVAGLKQAPFGLSQRDRKAFDEIMDPLRDLGIVKPVPLGKPCPAASPAFVVWSKGKPRVVVDLRKVNAQLYPDAYPLPRQDDVLSAMGGSVVFSSLDMTKSFFQQRILEQDQWKTAFVTPHRGQEYMTVSSMGLANTPGFFQHRMEDLLSRFLWNFTLVYIDDVIIYSRSLSEHLQHLDSVLGTLEQSGVTLSASKCHFAYPDIKLLGHHVSRLGISTAQDKVEAIREMKFPTTLSGLEVGIGFFGYYRSYVPHFAAIVDPLHRLKTVGFRNGPLKGRPRKKHADGTDPRANNRLAELDDDDRANLIQEAQRSWETLKERLCGAPVLAHPDFSRGFKVYIDGLLKWGFRAAIHQTQPEGEERPILFLSRALLPAERNYWATELEIGALV